MDQNQKKIFGESLMKKRKELGQTQINCAKHCGVSIVSYQNWERGICEPSENNMNKICEFLEINQREFL